MNFELSKIAAALVALAIVTASHQAGAQQLNGQASAMTLRADSVVPSANMFSLKPTKSLTKLVSLKSSAKRATPSTHSKRATAKRVRTRSEASSAVAVKREKAEVRPVAVDEKEWNSRLGNSVGGDMGAFSSIATASIPASTDPFQLSSAGQGNPSHLLMR